ncbi:retrovirus-related pol polyprotein from transposon TNT 1-94 [Tanacetum coccineum]
MRFRFEATNNEAEYEALIAGLRIAEQMGVKNLQENVDSRLVANQVNGSYVAKESVFQEQVVHDYVSVNSNDACPLIFGVFLDSGYQTCGEIGYTQGKTRQVKNTESLAINKARPNRPLLQDNGFSETIRLGMSLFQGFITFEGDLGNNLFSVGQFCDSNLEVAFRQHTCFIRNLDGVDLLTGSRGDNLYTLSLGNMMASSPICLLSKASKTKSWLWHRKSSKKPHKPKSEDTNQEKLYLLHMDLCGPIRVAVSVNGRVHPRYCRRTTLDLHGNRAITSFFLHHLYPFEIPDWDLLFQPMFDESLNSQPYVDLQAPEVIAPIHEVVAHEHALYQLAHLPQLQVILIQSSSSDVIHHNCAPRSQVSEHNRQIWTKVLPLDKYNRCSDKTQFQHDYKSPIVKGLILLLLYPMKIKDGKALFVDPSTLSCMIGTLLYLQQLDLTYNLFSICMCACYQAVSTQKHLMRLKWIVRVSKGTYIGVFGIQGFFLCILTAFCRCGSCCVKIHAVASTSWQITNFGVIRTCKSGRLKGRKALRYPVTDHDDYNRFISVVVL